MSWWIRSTWIIVLGALGALGSVACESGPRGVSSTVWPWAPVGVEFHGLSRFVERNDVELLSLRLEFIDVDGDPVKFPGMVTFEVDPETEIDETWTFEYDLSDLDENAVHWDRVTSTYRFELEVGWGDPPLPGTPIRVRVEAQSSETGGLKAGITVRRSEF